MYRICDLACQLDNGITQPDVSFLQYLADNPEILKRVSTYRIQRNEDFHRYYWTAAHLGARWGRQDMLEVFFRGGCPMENHDEKKRAPIWYSAAYGQLPTLEFLVECGVKCKYGDVDGWSPLHAAARYGHLEAVKYLIQQNVPINHTDCLGWTALHKAIWGDHLQVCSYLIRQGASVNAATFNDGITPLHIACYRLSHEGVKIFLSKSLDISQPSSKGVTPLMIACQLGSLDLAEYLIFSGAAPSERSHYASMPIHYAAEGGFSDIVSMLINKGANPNSRNKRGWSPFLLAARYGHYSTCRSLVLKGADPTVMFTHKHRGAVHYAAMSGDSETLKYLVCELELPFDLPDIDGLTPLHQCSVRGHTECAMFLIKFGASIDRKDKFGRSAVHFASSAGRLSLVRCLLHHGGSFWHAIAVICTKWKFKND